jgi:hypothetical protein
VEFRRDSGRVRQGLLTYQQAQWQQPDVSIAADTVELDDRSASRDSRSSKQSVQRETPPSSPSMNEFCT